ncbi:MAG: hypothetical protein ACFB15_15430 [Cyclobacteriaceae bacterium]
MADRSYTQKVGGWYAVAAATLGLVLFILIVEFIGVVLVGYHPIYLLRDLAYIYHYAFYAGILTSLLLSYLVGVRASQLIAVEEADAISIGVSSAFSAFLGCLIVSLVVLGLRAIQSDVSQELGGAIIGFFSMFLTLFTLGSVPTLVAGYLYGKLVKQKIEKRTN